MDKQTLIDLQKLEQVIRGEAQPRQFEAGPGSNYLGSKWPRRGTDSYPLKQALPAKPDVKS